MDTHAVKAKHVGLHMTKHTEAKTCTDTSHEPGAHYCHWPDDE